MSDITNLIGRRIKFCVESEIGEEKGYIIDKIKKQRHL